MTINNIITAVLCLLSVTFGATFPRWIIKRKNLTERDTLSSSKKVWLLLTAAILNIICVVYIGAEEKNYITLIILGLIANLSGLILIVDTRVHIIPNMCLFPMLLLMAGYHIIFRDYTGLINGFVAMFFTCYGILAITRLLGFNGYFGAGDIKYLSVGAFMFGLGINLVGFVVGWVASLFIVILPLLLLKKISRKSMIAYGPYISVGMFTGLMFLYF